MREDELFTMYDAQTKVASEMEQLRTLTANTSPKLVEVESAAKES